MRAQERARKLTRDNRTRLRRLREADQATERLGQKARAYDAVCEQLHKVVREAEESTARQAAAPRIDMTDWVEAQEKKYHARLLLDMLERALKMQSQPSGGEAEP